MESTGANNAIEPSRQEQIPLHPSSELPTRLRILTLGDPFSGKSCLIKHFCEGRFVQKHIATIGVDYGVRRVRRSAVVPADPVIDIRLNFFDTSGAAGFADVRSEFYREADVALLIFDTSSKQSFASLPQWAREAAGHTRDKHLPMVVVGTKTDLPRAVSTEDASRWAQDRGFPYFETSALSGQGVAQLFESLMDQFA